jgi:hypothetical protein
MIVKYRTDVSPLSIAVFIEEIPFHIFSSNSCDHCIHLQILTRKHKQNLIITTAPFSWRRAARHEMPGMSLLPIMAREKVADGALSREDGCAGRKGFLVSAMYKVVQAATGWMTTYTTSRRRRGFYFIAS